MSGGYDPILGADVVGMLDSSGDLSQAARDTFVAQVVALLVGGNRNGKGPKISSIIGIPFPPIAGPLLIDPDKLLLTPDDPLGPLFWFEPSPLVLPSIPFLSDPDKDYQKIIVNNLYKPLVKMLNVKGNMATFPIFDPTVAFPNVKAPDIPAFILGLPIALPTVSLPVPGNAPAVAFCAKFGITLADLLGFVVPPPIPLPSLPKLPSLPIPPDFDFIIFPDLFLGLLTIPLAILTPDIILPKIAAAFPPDPIALFKVILDLVLGLVLDLLQKIGLLVILPKLLAATIIIIIQNLVSMMVVDMIGMILGAGGLCKLAARALVLV
jgi:hypothetical protein